MDFIVVAKYIKTVVNSSIYILLPRLIRDIESGKLDFLAQEAIEDFENGFCKDVCINNQYHHDS
ncbi:MAG: hypothetical protein WCP16_25045 [Pseudanabaena sp. ELA645]|jgi:hypothetical protein